MSVAEVKRKKEGILSELECMNECSIPAREIFSIFNGPLKQLPLELPPSMFLIELKRSQDERQVLLKRHQAVETKKEFKCEINVVPNIVVFQRWNVDVTNTVKFTITNRLKNPLDIKVICEHSPNFRVENQSSARHCKLANGISTPFSVNFHPGALKDYKHKILIITAFSEVVVPIIAVGPRPILDFPDKIDFGEIPVKVVGERLLTISNVGEAQASITVITESPFAVSPTSAIIQPSQSFVLKVIFRSIRAGLFHGSLKICFDNGDEMAVQLISIAETSKVWLEQSNIEFPSTYVNLKCERSVILHNETDYALSFKWHQNPSPTHDMKIILNVRAIERELQMGQSSSAVTYHAGEHDHNVIFKRAHLDGARQMEHCDLYFKDPTFVLTPLRGTINPHSHVSISISFEPMIAQNFSTTAYCDVEGADQRFPLSITGTGTGPHIVANYDVIDFDLMFLKLEHTYELVFNNIGLIPGKIKFREPNLTYGGTVVTVPSELSLQPTESQIILVKFQSSAIGPFVEELFFDIVDAGKAIRVILKGRTVCPLLKFDQSYLDFGRIPFGFPITQILRVQNKSPIPATFRVEVKDDGKIPSMPAWAMGNRVHNYQMMLNHHPKEFNITPSSGVLMPYGSIDLEIILTPNLARECSTSLQIELQEIESKELAVPIHFIACDAKVKSSPRRIVHRFAFIDHPHEFDILLENEGETALFFYTSSQKAPAQDAIECKIREENGIINPNSAIRLTLDVMVTRLGKQEANVYTNIFGISTPLLLTRITAYGIGPMVTVDPYFLSWPVQEIGVPSTKEMKLSNTSPIQANWKISIEREGGTSDCDPHPWTVSVSEGVLDPDEDIVVEVTACLTDPKKVEADLILSVKYSDDSRVKLTGEGTGTSIVFDPPIMDDWDFGDIFINDRFIFPVAVKNIGTLHHRLMITNKVVSWSKPQGKTTNLCINVDPDRFDLDGCQGRELKISLHSETVCECSVDFYLYATINHKGRRALIKQSHLRASFIFPLLTVRPNVISMFLRMETLDMVLPTFITAESTACTTTLLPVDAECSTNPPFSLVAPNGDCGQTLKFHVTKDETRTLVKLNLEGLEEHEMRQISGLVTYTVMSKYKTRVPVRAAVLCPYVTVNDSEGHLGSAAPYVDLYSFLHMKNNGTLQAQYRWKALVDTFKYLEMPPLPLDISPEYREELTKGFVELLKLPKWSPKEVTYSMTPEDVGTVNSKQVITRFGVLSSTRAQEQQRTRNGPNDAVQGIQENDIVKINSRVVVDALCSILNKSIPLALITKDKENMPTAPILDGREWDIDLVPSFGNLPSKHQVILNVLVEPERLGIFEGTALCEIEGGLSQPITFFGASGPTLYTLEPNVINFGPRPFCQLWHTTFKIVNTGWVSFYYEINILSRDHLFEYSIRPRTFCISPSSKLVEAGSYVEVGVTFYPAFTGPIDSYFYLTVGSAPPKMIQILGLATMPQVEVIAPVDDLNRVPDQIEYSAIGRQLCNEWYDPTFSRGGERSVPALTSKEEHLCLKLPHEASHGREFLYPFEGGWVIVTPADFVPSEREIVLAIERELVHDYYHYLKMKMLHHTLYHDERKNEKPFPFFVTQGYKMDVGPVIIGCEAHCNLDIRNPGPLDADIRIRLPFKNKAYLTKKGITLDYQEELHLAPNGSTTIKCDVVPTRKSYKNLDADCSIEFVFFIEVACGAKVPVRFNTVVTCPYLSMKKKLDFGVIICGQKKMMKFLIKNPGCVPATWNCQQRKVRRKRQKETDHPVVLDEAETPFTIFPAEGTLDPLHYQFLEAEFLPTSGGKVEWVLEFFIMNRESPQTLRLIGEAIEPKVDVEPEDVDFGYIQPFSLSTFRNVTVTNNTPVPLEVFFPEFDYEIYEEEKIFSLLCHYYGVPNMFIPHWFYNTSMTQELKNIYYVKLGSLADSFYKIQEEERIRAQRASNRKSINRTSIKGESKGTIENSKANGGGQTGGGKSKKKGKKARSSVAMVDSKSDAGSVAKKSIAERPSSVKMEPEPSLGDKILAYLNYLNEHTEIPRRDLFQHLEEPKEDPKIPKVKKLIFFGGGPKTNHKFWGKHLAKRTNLLYTTIDELILIAASSVQYQPAAAVRRAINDAYCRIVMHIDSTQYTLPDQFDPHADIEDPLLDLLMKVTAIEREVEETREEEKRVKALRSALKIETRGPKSKSGGRRSLSPKRQSKSTGRRASQKSSRRASQKSGRRASQKAGRRASQKAGRRASQKSGRSQKSSRKTSQTSRRSAGLPKAPEDARKLDLEKPVFEDLPVDDLMNLIREYLIQYIKSPGIVLDYMRGFFIRDSVLAFTTVMKIIHGEDFDVSCVDLHSSYAFYEVIMENRTKRQEIKETEELNAKLNEIDRLDGFKFRDLDEKTKFFYIEQVNLRDKTMNELNHVGPQIKPKSAKSDKLSRSSTKSTTSVKSTEKKQDEGDESRKISDVIKTQSYISKIASTYDMPEDDTMKEYSTYDREMRTIRDIAENWNSKAPYWVVAEKPSNDPVLEKKTTPKKGKDKEKPKTSERRKTPEKEDHPAKAIVLDPSKKGFPLYVIHTMPYGQDKELEPFMNHMCKLKEFQGITSTVKPWDEVDVPPPMTYFWLMQPIVYVNPEGNENLAGPMIGPAKEDATTADVSTSVLGPTDEVWASLPGPIGDMLKNRSNAAVTNDKEPNNNDETTSSIVDVELPLDEELEKNETKSDVKPRRQELADPLMVGLLHTSNLATETTAIQQLQAEFQRMNPALKPYMNPIIEMLMQLVLKMYEEKVPDIFKKKRSLRSVNSLFDDKHKREEEAEEEEEFDEGEHSFPELIETTQFNIYGVSMEAAGEDSGPGVRTYLNPGESATWRIACSTRKCGELERTFLLEVGGWQKSLVPIRCHVISGIPSIDTTPEAMFPRVSPQSKSFKEYPVFSTETNKYEFGPVTSNKGQSNPRVFEVEGVIRFFNNSDVMIDELFLTFEEETSRGFTFEPEEFWSIKPGEERFLKVYAHPSSAGPIESTIWYSIKNNPENGFIKIACEGVSPRLTFKAEDFTKNKILLYRTIRRTLYIVNSSTRKLRWEIANAKELLKAGVKFSQLKGMVKPNDTNDVEVNYTPQKPGNISVQIHIKVYNRDKKGEPLQKENIPFEVEGVDVVVSIFYRWKVSERIGAWRSSDHLDYGRGRVDDMIRRGFALLNHSTTDFYYEISPRKKLPFTIDYSPPNGRLLNGKMNYVEVINNIFVISNHIMSLYKVEVTVIKPVKLKRMPCLDVEIYGPSDGEKELVCEIPVTMSLTCSKSKFNVYPMPDLDFGVTEVGEPSVRKIVFENLGDMALEISIMTKLQLELLVQQIEERKLEQKLLEGLKARRTKGMLSKASKASKASRGSRRASKKGSRRASKRASKSGPSRRASKKASKAASRRGSKKASTKRASKIAQSKYGRVSKSKSRSKSRSRSRVLSPPRQRQDILTFLDKRPFELGVFTISTNTITIQPGFAESIVVSAEIKKTGSYEEVLIICSPDTLREHPEKGIFYPLRATSALLNVDFHSPNLMYPDMTIVTNEDNVDLTDGEPKAAFNKDTNTISFYNVALSQIVSRTVSVLNVGFIDAAIDIFIEETPSEVNQEKAFGFNEERTEQETTVYVTKFGHTNFRLFFSPSALQKLKGVMRFQVRTKSPENVLYHEVNLEGIGVLPEITVLQPPSFDGTNGTLDLGKRAIDHSHSAFISFKNTGAIVCTVLAEILNEDASTSNQPSPFVLNVCDEMKSKYVRSPDPKDLTLGATTKFQIPRNHEVTIEVSFRPLIENLTYSGRLLLHTLYNPYVINTVSLTGVGSLNWLCLQGVPLLAPKIEGEVKDDGRRKKPAAKRTSLMARRQSSRGSRKSAVVPQAGSKRSVTPSSSGAEVAEGVLAPPKAMFHQIDFGTVSTGVLYSQGFELLNTSNEPCKFIWDHLPTVRMLPSEGHVFPKSSKKCFATFTSQAPIELRPFETVKCLAYPIVYDVYPTLQWDSETKTVNWISSLKDTTEVTTDEFLDKKEFLYPEPPHKKGSTGQEKSVVLFLKGRAVSPEVSMPDDAICMNTAFLYQKEEISMNVTNISDSPVEFTWNVRATEVYGVSSIFSPDAVVSTGPLGEGEYPGMLPPGAGDIVTPPIRAKRVPARHGYLYRPTALGAKLQPVESPREVRKSSLLSEKTHIADEHYDLSSYQNVFFVAPLQGTILPKETMPFKFTFIPPEPLEFFAQAKFQVKGQPESKIVELSGIGQMSSCHIEIAPSDYLSAGRRNPTLANQYQYDPKTTVIEMRVVGVGVVYRRRFIVMNPTESLYHFQWRLEHIYTDHGGNEDRSRNPPVSCCSKFGIVKAKKKEQMIFEFRPKHTGTYEALWTLEISELELKHPVLFVGIVTEPKVSLSPTILQLRSTLKGIATSGDVSIANNEEIPISFVIDETTLRGVGPASNLEVAPKSGTVNAHETSQLRFTYVPNSPGEETFNVICDVKRRSTPLEVIVRTACYYVDLIFQYSYKHEQAILKAFKPNIIDLGRIYERIPSTIEFTLTNVGQAPWYFHCQLDNVINDTYCVNLTLSRDAGLVMSNQTTTYTLSVTALKKVSFQNVPFTMKVTKGPDYVIYLSGNSCLPACKFSFLEFDFGPRIILDRPDTDVYCMELTVTNLEDEPIVLLKTSEDPDCFVVDILSCVIPPRARIIIPVSFVPLVTGAKVMDVNFLINDVKEESVRIMGEGVDMDIQLVNGRDEDINFGIVEALKTVKREIEVTNACKCTVNLRLSIAFCEGFLSRLTPKVLEIPPMGTAKFEISLSPSCGGVVFDGGVKYQVGDKVKTLLTAHCIGGGYKISLNREHIPFPHLTLGSSMVDSICLVNRGQYPARFEWILDQKGKDLFTIVPKTGNSNPGSSIAFEVTFYPTKQHKTIRNEARCILSNGQSLSLKLSGACTEMPPTRKLIEIITPVRQKTTETIIIQNPTYTPWKVFPVVSGKYFSAADRIEVLPHDIAEYVIEYYPFTSTFTSDHKGSVFLSLPDGRSLMYLLIGKTTQPDEEDSLKWDFRAKEEAKHTIEVQNWLYEPQRMKVSFQRSDGEPERFVIQGPEYLDLPPNPSKTYTYDVSVYAFDEGVSRWVVELVNENTNEMMFYQVNMVVKGHKIFDKFTMETHLRRPVYKELVLENLSAKVAEVELKSPTAALKLVDSMPLIIPPNKKATATVEYLPIAFPIKMFGEEEQELEQQQEMNGEDGDASVETHVLEFVSDQLGSFFFNVTLIAHDALPEAPAYVEAHISSPTIFTLSLQMFTEQRQSFQFKSTCPDIWLLENDLEREPSGQTLIAKCIYSPSELGKITCQLTFYSYEAGTYTFPIVATGFVPKPMGPILFETGENKSIAFQNIFPDVQMFKIQFSNAAFLADNDYFTLDSNEVKVITITMLWASIMPVKEQVFESYPIATQMTVLPDNPPHPGISWVFYLKGRHREMTEEQMGEQTERLKSTGSTL